MDLHDLSDEELAYHLNAVLAEQERRARLARAPEQVAQMAAQYVADGGDRAALLEAVSTAERSSEGFAL
ncbi:hypothetical protein J2X55_002404 [Microbacterium sp. 1154]|uniref:hypothetical protein n=1 Tax=Microbacterium sp. 1154 TaxID=2817733 RepID=UPI0028581868|nr:hypothetical protein [Microbacterium sp. 1154]MDR6691481.1 hypothetical protein [Microbacterium sp. 1154]